MAGTAFWGAMVRRAAAPWTGPRGSTVTGEPILEAVPYFPMHSASLPRLSTDTTVPEALFSRELSSLAFNERVLAEAANPRQPLL